MPLEKIIEKYCDKLERFVKHHFSGHTANIVNLFGTMGVGVSIIWWILALLAGLCLYRAFVVSVIWNWFLVPMGLPHLSLQASFAIIMIFWLWTTNEEVTKEDSMLDVVGKSLLFTTLPLIGAWVVYQFT